MFLTHYRLLKLFSFIELVICATYQPDKRDITSINDTLSAEIVSIVAIAVVTCFIIFLCICKICQTCCIKIIGYIAIFIIVISILYFVSKGTVINNTDNSIKNNISNNISKNTSNNFKLFENFSFPFI